MQTDKKPSAISNELFDLSKTISNVSLSGNLYGKLFMIKEMQIFLNAQEKEINEQIKEQESNK
tara:strand:- start:38 stop:226 length:189 start_codon:yes stop_codon:yes gene_type:complete